MTSQFKEECKNSANCNRLGKVIYDTDKEISYDNNLASIEMVEDCYANGTILGTVNTKGLTVKTIGKEDLYNKDIDAKIGVKYGDTSEEYINMGKYTVDKPNDQETANLGQYKAYDYLDKLNEDYTCNITDWTDITVADIYEDLCEQSGLIPETLDFDNSDIPVTGDIFEEGYKRKDVLSDIAELAGSYVDIDKDTNVVKLKRLETNAKKTVTGNNDIYIEDALNHSIYDMKIDGNAKQTTTTGKNLLKYQADHIPGRVVESNGVTFTVNEDYSITINGTNNGKNSPFYIANGLTIPAGTYISNLYGSGWKLSYYNGSKYLNWNVARTFNEETTFSQVYIEPESLGRTYNNVIIYPMLVSGSESPGNLKSVYEPYTGGNPSPNPDYPQEIESVHAYNLLENELTTQEKNGVTFTVNEDKSITVNGTATANTYLNLKNAISLKKGNYYFQGCPKNGNVSTYCMEMHSGEKYVTDAGNGKGFTVGEETTYEVYIAIKKDVTVDNLNFYPMITDENYKNFPYAKYGCVKLKLIGKNFLDSQFKLQDQTTNGITVKNCNDGSYDVNGTATDNFTIPSDYIDYKRGVVLQKGTYYQSCGTRLKLYNLDGAFLMNTFSKFTLEEPAIIVGFYLEFTKGASYNRKYYYQVEEGSAATEYEAFQSNEYAIDLQGDELVKLYDKAQDVIEIDKNGNVSLQKNTRHLSLAIADMNNSSTYPGWRNISALRKDYPNKNDLLSSVASFKSNISNNYLAFGINTTSSGTLFFRRSFIPLTQEEWLAQYPDLVLELYYSLQNTETVDLGKIQNFKTYDGVNHFFLETNLSTNFEIRYAQNIHNASIEPVSTLSKDNYSSLTKNQKYGPVNSLVIKESEAEGENVSLQDDNSIAINGETQVNIVDNIFLYTPELRQQVIDKIWDAVSGLTYYDCKIESYTGLPYLNKGDRISVEDDAGNYFDTYVLKHTFTYDGTFKSVIESPALTLQETKIKSPVSLGQMLTQTRINVDKANKNINLLNSQVSDTNSKIAEINIDLSEISQSVVEINNENASIKESLNDYATNDTVAQQINSVEQKITSNNLKIDVIEETLENGVSKVKTETGFTFDNNGLNISSSDSKVNNTLSEIGMEIEDNSTGETLLFAGYDNELQETVVISKNLTVEKYLNIPHARFERYDNPNHGVGTGCFYIE